MTGRVPTTDAYEVDGYSERSYFGSLIGFLHPYNVLRLLAENERNLNAELEWRYGLLVCNGWAEEREFVPGVRRSQTFLIATEGSSDTRIIKHAISLLRPEMADFFVSSMWARHIHSQARAILCGSHMGSPRSTSTTRCSFCSTMTRKA